jgi:NitT/TauT family transport system substrate-binding protein
LVSAVELAPVRWAANGIYPAKVSISSGGVDNLFDANAPLVATNAETQALRASVQHGNLRIIFTVCEGLYRIVAKKSSGINALADLRGKRIAAPSGTSSHYYLSRMLGSAGLTEQDVTLVNESPGMGTLNADAATIWEPGIQYVEDALGNDAVEFQNAADGNPVYRELFNLHATAESLADPVKRRTIVQFVRSLITASAQIREDPSVVFPLMLSPTGESQADLEKSWNYERFPGTLVSDILDVLEEEEPWRANLDHRSARTRDELAMLVDDSVVKEAMAQ